MLQPRLASWRIDRDSFARDVFGTTREKWEKLPPQWRGYALHRSSNVDALLQCMEEGTIKKTLDPQGVYDAFLGHVPQ